MKKSATSLEKVKKLMKENEELTAELKVTTDRDVLKKKVSSMGKSMVKK